MASINPNLNLLPGSVGVSASQPPLPVGPEGLVVTAAAAWLPDFSLPVSDEVVGGGKVVGSPSASPPGAVAAGGACDEHGGSHSMHASGGGPAVIGGGNIGGGGVQRPEAPIRYSVGAGASLSFPSLMESSRSHEAPAVRWGAGWKPVAGANGQTTMQHENGAVARISAHGRTVVSPARRVRFVMTPFGKGKRFPDGTVIIHGIGGSKRPFRIDSEGRIHPLAFGRHRFGGVSVNVVEVTYVGVTMPDGRRVRFDSRGHSLFLGARSQAGASAGALGIAGGGAGNRVAGDVANLTGQATTLIASALERLQALGGSAGAGSGLEALLSGLKDTLAGISHVSGGGAATVSVNDRLRASSARAPRPGESIAAYIMATLGETVSGSLADPGGTPEAPRSRPTRQAGGSGTTGHDMGSMAGEAMSSAMDMHMM